MNKLIIIGASGHGKVVSDIATKMGYENIVFLDDDIEIKQCLGFPVIGSLKILSELEGDVFVAIGDAAIREQIMKKNIGRSFPTLIHPSAVLGEGVKVGEGTAIMGGAVINPDAKIGRGCIINTSSSVDHDCIIGDFVHVSVGSHLCGNVVVGKGTWIGAGATIKNNVLVCDNCLIGAGAVVIKTISSPGTYAGVPVRQIK